MNPLLRAALLACTILSCTCLAAPAATILCLGDSLTAGYGVDESEAWPAQVAVLAKAADRDWVVINAGVSGDTTAGGLRRLAWALRAKPDVVVVALGGNDGLRGIDPATTKANLATIIDRIRAAGAQVMLAGMRLPPNYGEAHRAAFAALYGDLARDQQVPLLPFLLEGVGGVAALNQADGIHPTAEGQRRIAALVDDFLATQVPAQATVSAP